MNKQQLQAFTNIEYVILRLQKLRKNIMHINECIQLCLELQEKLTDTKTTFNCEELYNIYSELRLEPNTQCLIKYIALNDEDVK